MTDISKERFLENGMDIAGVFGINSVCVEEILSMSMDFMHGCFVEWLNDNGHEIAGQDLDDAWHSREEQWWREPDGFDGRYKHGEEKRREIFGNETS